MKDNVKVLEPHEKFSLAAYAISRVLMKEIAEIKFKYDKTMDTEEHENEIQCRVQQVLKSISKKYVKELSKNEFKTPRQWDLLSEFAHDELFGFTVNDFSEL